MRQLSLGRKGAYHIARGDVAAVLAGFADNSFDALMCDPPYGLRFMSKSWDYDVPSVALWAECWRVLKPGAPLVAFGGARTYHRLACAVEDAGFELRDQLMWLYGKGFPKSQNIGLAIGTVPAKAVDVTAPATEFAQAWDGYGTALKPAHEPILLARKPLDGTMAQNVARWGVGALAIDACRIGEAGGTTKGNPPKEASNGIYGDGLNGACDVVDLGAGRWPANLLLTHAEACRFTGQTRTIKNNTATRPAQGTRGGTGASFAMSKPPGTPDAGYGEQEVEVWECADDCPISLLDKSVAPTQSVPYPEHTADGAVLPMTKRAAGVYADAGGPSRFFYCSKVSTREREAGCEGLALRSAGEVTERSEPHLPWCPAEAAALANAYVGQFEGARFLEVPPCECPRPAGLDNARAGAGRTGGARNHHPTLKPISLTTWLARLIMPPVPGAVIVPFAGAGSEMIGAIKAGWRSVLGIEREEAYAEIARARLAHWCPESEAAAR